MFRDLRQYRRDERRERHDANHAAAVAADDGGWTKHTPTHWSRMLAGRKLQYWPGAAKWHYLGSTSRGDSTSLASFIAKRNKGDQS